MKNKQNLNSNEIEYLIECISWRRFVIDENYGDMGKKLNDLEALINKLLNKEE